MKVVYICGPKSTRNCDGSDVHQTGIYINQRLPPCVGELHIGCHALKEPPESPVSSVHKRSRGSHVLASKNDPQDGT